MNRHLESFIMVGIPIILVVMVWTLLFPKCEQQREVVRLQNALKFHDKMKECMREGSSKTVCEAALQELGIYKQ